MFSIIHSQAELQCSLIFYFVTASSMNEHLCKYAYLQDDI